MYKEESFVCSSEQLYLYYVVLIEQEISLNKYIYLKASKPELYFPNPNPYNTSLIGSS